MTRRRQYRAAATDSGSRRGRCHRLAAAVAVATGICTLLAGAAQASTVTIGSVLPITFTSKKFEQVETFFNTTLPEKGANLTSPATGAIIRWRAQGLNGGPYYLRVLRPTGSGAYTATGTSGAATPTGSGLQTFSVSMPIEAGDLIGVDPTNATDEIGIASVSGAGYASIFPPPFDNSTVAPSGGESGQEIELSAEVQPVPQITSVSPASGSIAGGSKVIITGANFTAASAVKFGSVPASSFAAESDTQITAIAPPGAVPGRVDLSVTTLAGNSPTARAVEFNYLACVVPKLKGKKLQPAKSMVRRANCKLGTIKGAKGSSARVLTQKPKPGSVLAPESKVNIKLGR